MSEGRQLQQIRVFLSSPGDVAIERQLVREIARELSVEPFLRDQAVVTIVSWDDPAAPAPMLAQLTPQEALDQAVDMLRPGGQLVMIGTARQERICFDVDTFRRNELSILYIRRQNNCVQRAMDLIAGGQVNVDFMATHHFPLEETKKAFDLVAGYRDGVIKAMIDV